MSLGGLLAIARNSEKERSECRDLGLEPTLMFVSGNPNWLGQDMRRQLGRTFNASHGFKAIRLSALGPGMLSFGRPQKISRAWQSSKGL